MRYLTICALTAISSPVLGFDCSQRINDLSCLACNIYFEARGEDNAGKLMVAMVTINRAANSSFPNSYCGVVWQPHQFSWTNDGKSDIPREISEWEASLRIANLAELHMKDSSIEISINGVDIDDPLYFHSIRIHPNWDLAEIGTIGNHVFYQ